MKKLVSLLVVISILISVSACQRVTCGPDKNSFIGNYEKFIDKIDALDLSVADKGWEKHDATFKHYIEDCYDYYESDLTTREKRRFWMQSLKYYANRYGEGMINELSREDGISEKVKQNIEDVLDATGRDLEDFVNKNMDQIEDLVKDIGKDIEEWAAKLKEIFEEK
jgi:ABC-type Zn uptake system ZnuABC Zn-binding protein ZnuA